MNKQERKNKKAKLKRIKPPLRSKLPPNKRHKSKKDYKRKKVITYEIIIE
jgi:hypothetical protein